MNSFDYVLLIIIALSAVAGLLRGFVSEVLSLLSWLLAFFVALYFAQPLSDVLVDQFASSNLRFGIAFGALFIGTMIISSLSIYLISKLISGAGLGATDRILGFVFGGLRGSVICIVGLIALRSFAQGADWWTGSQITPILLGFEETVLDLFGRAGGAVSDVKDAITNPDAVSDP